MDGPMMYKMSTNILAQSLWLNREEERKEGGLKEEGKTRKRTEQGYIHDSISCMQLGRGRDAKIAQKHGKSKHGTNQLTN